MPSKNRCKRIPRSTGVTIFLAVLITGALALLLPAASVLMALRDTTANEITGILGGSTRQTVTIDGDPARFDPVASLNQVMSLAGPGARLEVLRTAGVRRDGTLDLTAAYSPAPSATYELHRDAPAPKNAPPVGAGGSADGRWYQSLRIEAAKPGRRRRATLLVRQQRTRPRCGRRVRQTRPAPCAATGVRLRPAVGCGHCARRAERCGRADPLRCARLHIQHSWNFQPPL